VEGSGSQKGRGGVSVGRGGEGESEGTFVGMRRNGVLPEKGKSKPIQREEINKKNIGGRRFPSSREGANSAHGSKGRKPEEHRGERGRSCSGLRQGKGGKREKGATYT